MGYILKPKKKTYLRDTFFFFGAAIGNRTRILAATERCNNHYTIAAILPLREFSITNFQFLMNCNKTFNYAESAEGLRRTKQKPSHRRTGEGDVCCVKHRVYAV